LIVNALNRLVQFEIAVPQTQPEPEVRSGI
jgi:hypothetical protein